ncbi:MAG: hypothetical protein J6I73_01445 [Treponema sp.]|nr:hypothetical protein [Treponema sp.]
MVKKKLLVLGTLVVFVAGIAFARDTKKKVQPDFSATIEAGAGWSNLGKNETLEEIPGFSDSGVSSTLDLKLKGSFFRASEWGVEKENGILQKSGVGYEVNISTNMAKLYELAFGKDYASSSDTNYYSLIQPMIDWYEANRVRFDLPYNPCGTPDGSPWPTTAYGASNSRYRFIVGSTVERADDVAWNTTKWADAQALYNEIKNKIGEAIDNLYALELSTGDVSQFQYAGLSDSMKRKAELKQKAKAEFAKVSSGKSDGITFKEIVPSAYVKVTNIANMFDIRADFTGSRLAVGSMIVSQLAGTREKGSSLAVTLKNGFLKGFEADVVLGIAGGEKQIAENWDTQKLDYWSGVKSELALKTSARYTMYLEKISSELVVQGGGVMTDLLVAPTNFALNAYARWNTYGFGSYGGGMEAVVLNWRDRNVDGSSSQLSFAVSGDAHANIFGAALYANASYKGKQFSHVPCNTVEDRFYGVSAESDYNTANLSQAMQWSATVSFNPQYFLSYDIVTVKGGVRGFHYGDKLSMNGFGFFANVEADIQDITRVPVRMYGGMDYYKNSKLAEWDDMSSLPERKFVDFTSWNIGAAFTPIKDVLTICCEYRSKPSLSRRASRRISSLSCTAKISL